MDKIGEFEINKIYCMDCLEGLKKLPDNSVDLVVTDPPYNMEKAEWDKIQDYVRFFEQIKKEVLRILKPNKAFWIFGNHYNIAEVKIGLDKSDYFRIRSWIIWNKRVGTPNSLNFTNLYEHLLYYLKIPSKKEIESFGKYIKQRRIDLDLSLKEIGDLCGEKWYHRGGHLYFETGLTYPNVEQYNKLKEVLKLDNRFDLWFDNNFIFNLKDIGIKWKYEKDKRNKRGYKNTGDVWNITQISGTFKEREEHPTQKPLELMKRIIKVSSNKSDICVDMFMGSGTTAVACKQLGRKFIGFEINPEYVKIANKRLAQEVLI